MDARGTETTAPRRAPGRRLPNIVFVLADDLGAGDLSCTGQRRFSTPAIDRLAAGGMRFTRHYSGSPVCAPSRCVLMTGRHPGHVPIRDNKDVGLDEQMPLPRSFPILSEMLAAQGYVCGGFGKWGLGKPGNPGDPLTRGFDRFFGYHGQRHAHNHYPAFLDDGPRRVPLDNPDFSPHQKLGPGKSAFDPANHVRFAGREWAPERIHREALSWIEAHRDHPFFCYLPTTVPHLALQAPPQWIAREAGRHGADVPYVGDKSYLPSLSPRATYAALIGAMDRQVGEVVDTIRRLGLEQDTLFVFTSDNGPLYDQLGGTDTDWFDSAAGLRGRKGSMHEGGIRVPAIVSWKGRIRPGQVTDSLSSFEDWVPTLLDLVGARRSIPAGCDGVSHASELLGSAPRHRNRTLYREFAGYGGWQAVWRGRHKCVRGQLGSGRRPWALHDLVDDPGETRDLAALDPRLVAELDRHARAQHVPSRDFPLKGLGDP